MKWKKVLATALLFLKLTVKYRCDCSVRTGFTLFGHCSWQANLIFWMAALAAVGREAEGVRIRYTLGLFIFKWEIWCEFDVHLLQFYANLIKNSLIILDFFIGLVDLALLLQVTKLHG